VPATKATNGAAARKHHEAERQLRYALEHALDYTPPSVGVSPVLGALATLVDFDDSVDCAAFEMAETAILTLLTRSPELRGAVWAWHGHRYDCDTDRDVLALLELTRAVELTIYVCRVRPVYLTTDKGGAVVRRALTVTGRGAVKRLRAFLVRRFGERVPSVDDLSDWIGRHAPTKGRGKLVTARIVARIVHRGRLLGARGEDENRTLRRVTMALKRHKFTSLVK
jgi:hypothetical protein